jgi:hypothetical protein
MTKTSDADTAETQPAPSGRGPRWRIPSPAAAVAGPLLIVAAVLAVLHGLAFRGILSFRHPDLIGAFLPSWCFLGRTLRAGHVPGWNLHVMGGVPFAADPLTGWMYLPVMLLFSLLPCQAAMTAFIVLQPIIAGLGIHAFLRSEGSSRAGATVGGLVIALAMSGTYFVYSLPFTATLAWTAVTLAAASRLLRSSAWPGRLFWLALTALAWGQLAGAHLANGLFEGTLALLIYLAARLTADVRAGRRSTGEALGLAGLLLVAFPFVNLAFLLPRLGYLHDSTVGLGYFRLQSIAARLTGSTATIPALGGVSPILPLRLTAAPGLYIGAAAVLLAFASWRALGRLHLAVAFALYGALSYLLALHAVAAVAAPHLKDSSFGSFYAHEPQRFVYQLVLAVAVLAGLGVDGWLRARSLPERIAMAAVPLLLFGALPALLGLHRSGWLPPLAAVSALTAMALVAGRPALAPILPCLVAAELVVGGIVTVFPSWLYEARTGPGGAPALLPYLPPRTENVPLSDYLQPGPIARALEVDPGGRYLTIAPEAWTWLGYQVRTGPADRGLMDAQQSMLFDRALEEGQGYDSIQLVRYWELVRAVDPKRIAYNAAGFTKAGPPALDLLQVDHVIQPANRPPVIPGAAPVARQGRWELYALAAPAPRASVVTSWTIVDSSDASLSRIREPGFDPARTAVLEQDPGLGSSSGPAGRGGSASFRWTGLDSAEVTVMAPSPAIVLVRNVFEKHWRATVDGRPAPVLPTDHVDQGIPVGAGRHVIELRYTDPTIGFGLAGSALSLAILFGLSGAGVPRSGRQSHRRSRRHRSALRSR